MSRALRIAHVAPPIERVPPHGYGGTERIVHELVVELDASGPRSHDLRQRRFDVPGRHVETVPVALRPKGYGGDVGPYMLATMREVIDQADEFDIVHSHLEWWSLLLAQVLPVPVVTTFHGRLDHPWARDAFQQPAGGPRRDQPEPGFDPPRRALDRHLQRLVARGGAVRPPAQRRACASSAG